MESKIIKLKESYQLSLKGIEPKGDLVKQILNLDLGKKDLISLYKTIDNCIQDDNKLKDLLYKSNNN